METEIKSLVHSIKEIAIQKGKTFATAESCTGGMIGSFLTNESGISECYLGGIISYANEVKRKILGVDETILRTVGAVSKECARQMAIGAQKRLSASVAISVTGIAGPGGGSSEKPVGLVYTGVSTENGSVSVKEDLFPGSREKIRLSTVKAALTLLLDTLERM